MEKKMFLRNMGLIILGLGGVLFLVAIDYMEKAEIEKAKNIEKIRPTDFGDAEKVIDKHLKATSRQIEIQLAKRKIEIEAMERGTGDLRPAKDLNLGKKPINIDNVDDSYSNRTTDPYGNSVNYMDPKSVILDELAHKQTEEKAAQKYREEYYKKFMENAKREGWKVEVDKKGRVKRVDQIPQQETISIGDPTAEENH